MELSQKPLELKSLELGKIFENRTLIYLVPALREYGTLFTAKLSSLPIKAFGIYDEDLKDVQQFTYRKCIYIMIDTSIRKSTTTTILNWFRNQSYFVDIVPFRNPEDNIKLLVVDFPDKLEGAFDKFIEGKYSFMYTKHEVNKFFNPQSKLHQKALKVINKSKIGGEEHIQSIEENFGTRLTPEDLRANGYQYDYPPNKKQEFFNYRKDE